MIHFITDRRPGQSDILPGAAHHPLSVTRLDGALIATVEPPAGGWTHELLEQEAERLREDTRAGADAWLGTTWVGSTEC